MTQPIQCTHPNIRYPGLQAPTQGMTVMVIGPIGTWKTTFAGTWPSPVFLSCGSEGGDDSLGFLPSIWGVPVPPTFPISSVIQMKEMVNYVLANARTFGWKTVVIDSATIYVDTWIQDCITLRYNELASKRSLQAKEEFQLAMTQADWGLLEYHVMKELVGKLHNSGLNVIWTALPKDKTASDGKGGRYTIERLPDIPGGTGRKLPGVCKLVLWAEKEQILDPNRPGEFLMIPKYYTRPPNPMIKIVRHRYGPQVFPHGYLVDPQYGAVPTFNAVASQIGQYIVQ